MWFGKLRGRKGKADLEKRIRDLAYEIVRYSYDSDPYDFREWGDGRGDTLEEIIDSFAGDIIDEIHAGRFNDVQVSWLEDIPLQERYDPDFRQRWRAMCTELRAIEKEMRRK